MTQHTPEPESFLSDLQLEGRGKKGQENQWISLEDAMAQVSQIKNQDAIEYYKSLAQEDFPTTSMEWYCHDCRQIVAPGKGKTLRGNPRTVCGVCAGKKVSSGTPSGLRKYYHLNEDGKREPRSERKN